MFYAQCSRSERDPQGIPIASLDRCRPATRIPRHDRHHIEIVGICTCRGLAGSGASADVASFFLTETLLHHPLSLAESREKLGFAKVRTTIRGSVAIRDRSVC